MNLINFILSDKSSEFLSEEGFKYYEKINYSCEVHKEELIVEDGYVITGMDISYGYDPKFIDYNPHFVWLGQTLNKPIDTTYEPTKIIFCPTCEENKNNYSITYNQNPNKRTKGQRSKKYKKKK